MKPRLKMAILWFSMLCKYTPICWSLKIEQSINNLYVCCKKIARIWNLKLKKIHPYGGRNPCIISLLQCSGVNNEIPIFFYQFFSSAKSTIALFNQVHELTQYLYLHSKLNHKLIKWIGFAYASSLL